MRRPTKIDNRPTKPGQPFFEQVEAAQARRPDPHRNRTDWDSIYNILQANKRSRERKRISKAKTAHFKKKLME